MSTAGKVLVVLVLLTIPIWVVLIAGVARLNAENTQAVERLKIQVAKLEAESETMAREVQSLRDDISLEQIAMDEEQAIIRTKLAEIERIRTQTLEVAERVKLQYEGVLAAEKSALTAKEKRTAEFEAETKGLAEARAEVETRKTENAQMMDELAKLRAEFRTTLASNRKLVDRLLKGGSAPKPERAASVTQ